MDISSEIFPDNQSNSDAVFYETVQGFTMFSLTDIISLLLGLPTNSYVIWLIVTGTGNGLAAELFSLNLSVCAILLSVNSLLNLLTYKFQFSTMVTIAIQGLGTACHPLFQALICVERYLAVVHPVSFLKFKPLRYRLICSVVVWVATFISSAAISFFMTTPLILVVLGLVLFQLMPVLSIQLFCCLAVLRALKQSGPGDRWREREEENHMKRRAFRFVQIITLTIVFIYAPYIISFLIFFQSDFLLTAFSISVACFELVGLVPPFLFLYRVDKMPFIKCQ